MVSFDHGVGRHDYQAGFGEFHYMFEDQNGTVWGPDNNHQSLHPGNGVYDMDIYPLTDPATGSGKCFFVLINACMSGNYSEWQHEDPPGSGIYYPVGQGFVNGTHAQSMPFAWTHHVVKNIFEQGFNTAQHMSEDGYAHADTGDFVYIGFEGGSAALNQTIEGLAPYWWWLEHFFSYALRRNWSVIQALNHATQDFFYCDFDEQNSPLGGPEGFNATWPMYKNNMWYYSGFGIVGKGYMRVYGNGNIKLYQPLLNVNAYDTENTQVWPTFYIDGNSHGTGSLRLFSGTHTITVNDIQGYNFLYLSYGGSNYNRPATLSITSNSTLTARYVVDPTPPNTPTLDGPSPPPPTHIYESYSFWAYSTDINGDQIRYTFDWDDSTSTTTGYIPSGTLAYASHSWSSTGQFSVTVTAQDDTGLWSSQSTPIIVNVQIYHSLGISAGEGGSTDPSPGSYEYIEDAEVEVSADAEYGYEFDYWLLDGQNAGSQNPITVTMDSDHTLQPVFSEIPRYTLSISAGSGGTTDPSPDDYEYFEDTEVQVYADAGVGYEFDYWLKDGQNVGDQNPITVIMDDDHTLEAVFYQVQQLYWLTVEAYDIFDSPESPVYTPVYIDGVYAGYSFEPIQVTEGLHDVGVDNTVWNPEYNRYEIFYFFSEGSGSNPTQVSVTSDKTVAAAYINYGKK